MQSVAARDRVVLLDVLRGFALFGIVIVNSQQLFRPGDHPQLTAASPPVDRLARFLVDLLFEGKFFPIYSFLFGLGTYVLVRRVERDGLDVMAFFRRRLGVLALFGVLHGTLLWTGDILFAYSVAGYFLVRYHRLREPRSMLKWSISLLALLPVILLAGAALTGLLSHQPETTPPSAPSADVREEQKIFSRGTYLQVTQHRLKEFLLNQVVPLPVFCPTLLGLFLLGYHAGLTGRLFDRATLRRTLLWSLPVGLLLCFAAAWAGFEQHYSLGDPTWRTMLRMGALMAGGLILAQAYISLVSLTWTRLQILAPAGRMALTNYLTQSLVLSTLAYGYGLGQFGKLGQASLMAIAAALYLLQLAFSHWWLRHHPQGPLERLWRWATFPALPPVPQVANASEPRL